MRPYILFRSPGPPLPPPPHQDTKLVKHPKGAVPHHLISPPRTPSPGPPAPPPDPQVDKTVDSKMPPECAEKREQSGLKYMSMCLQVELVGWRERRGSVQSSIITRTTHYDASQGGFVTEVDIAK